MAYIRIKNLYRVQVKMTDPDIPGPSEQRFYVAADTFDEALKMIRCKYGVGEVITVDKLGEVITEAR